ncbi:MAG: toxin-antitoxin system HicB family antitoxin, partial [Chloroflexi bacterium]|nr:toxin-antitoxin system HicB family antitoxin [Chloroflexota bacterium]
MDTNSLPDAYMNPSSFIQHIQQKVIFLRVAPELHTALKAQAKQSGATVNKFLTAHIEQLSA